MVKRAFLLLAVACAISIAVGHGSEGVKKGTTMAFQIKSSAFDPNGEIPRKYTCDGPDFSPALSWTEPPQGTQSFSLSVDDPDAPVGTWVHWVLYNLPATARELPEAVPKDGELKDGSRQGRNDFRKIGYGGPCPPPGPAHRYFFKLSALDTRVNLRSGATKAELLRAMEGHILGQAELVGRYKR